MTVLMPLTLSVVSQVLAWGWGRGKIATSDEKQDRHRPTHENSSYHEWFQSMRPRYE